MESCGWGGQAERIVDDLSGLAQRVEPGLIPPEDAVTVAGLFTKAERLCCFLKTVFAKRAQDRSTWAREGYRSPEEWFARMTGIGVGAARDQLEVAASLDDQPEIPWAWRGQGSLMMANG